MLEMGPLDGERPNPTRKITNWKRMSTALEKIDAPTLHSILNDISITEEIDFAIYDLNNHMRTVIEKCKREVLSSSDRRRLPPNIIELIRERTQLCAAHAHILLLNRARVLQREVRTRVQEFRNENWGDLSVTDPCRYSVTSYAETIPKEIVHSACHAPSAPLCIV
ncbi:hypothetical protein EVAR_24943_1 [Eumeta japonica]|uniref:Uncharacterized protein n=1 Tax=Eumeta variegata TaxID=151549 RepID=A0A4C1ZYW2_EUMVA|nr:hypothetical protein EVAR_24943_1 [Eumeta japonica]